MNDHEATCRDHLIECSQNKQLLNILLNTLPHPLYLVDANTNKIIMANSASGLIPNTSAYCYKMCHDTDVQCTSDTLVCPIEQVKLTGKSFITEHEHRGLHGQLTLHQIHAFPVYNSNSQIHQVVLYHVDITERKQTEKALKESEKRHLELLENARSAIIHLDNLGQIIYINNYAEILFECQKQDVIHKPIINSLFNTNRSNQSQKEIAYKLFLPDQDAWDEISDELEWPLPSGKSLFISWKSKPLFDEFGQRTGLISVGHDITERKEAIDVLEIARQAAEAASHAKSEFLANVSHEIRTPMNGIIGMTDLLLKTNLDTMQQKFAQLIKISTDSLMTVLNDLLDLSKIEAGKIEIEHIDFNLSILVSDVADLQKFKAQEKNIHFDYTIDPNVPVLICGDPGRLRQIVLNLTNNAIKFTQQGSISINVTYENITDTQVTLRFEVTDTGIGIPEDRIDKLFKPFSQIDASITRKYGGTGLGLAISQQLVKLMKGKIGVQSIYGKGSTFWFTIVCDKSTSLIDQKTIINDPVILKDKHVLVVDDYHINLEIISQYLDSWGCRCKTVSDPEKVIKCLHDGFEQHDPFDIAIIDDMMPIINGKTLGKRIKQDALLKTIPLIMLTSPAQRGDAIHVKEIGFSAYLTKPIKESILYDCLYTVLAQTEHNESSGQKSPWVTRYTISEQHQATRIPKHQPKVHILVAEDNPINLELIHFIFNNQVQYQIHIATNGIEAIRILEKGYMDLVLMDLQMPEMDGLEATRYIRNPKSSVLNHKVPIIAMTAFAMKEDREKCMDAGMNAYISKPINAAVLFDMITQILSNHDVEKTDNAPYYCEVPPEKKSSFFDKNTFLTDRVDNNLNIAKKIIIMFLTDYPTRLTAIKEAIDEADSLKVRNTAHFLKGMVRVFSIDVSERLLVLENMGKSGNLHGSSDVWHLLSNDIQQLSLELKEFQKEIDATLANKK
ncbi:MAG: response regulator [Desulfobacterales bacterium]|nr:response regulator [Desulfobacterales bacterium]